MQPRRVEHELGRRHPVRAVRGHDRGVGIAQLAQRRRPDLVPVGVQHQKPGFDLGQVAVLGVPWHIALEKYGAMALRSERPDQRPPQYGVAVAP